jgi:putative Mg2+ transporter-C (MgtC) family protein
VSHHDLVLLGRVVLAFGLCFAVGFEREVRGAPAGDRTFALVGTGAAAVAAVTVGPAPQAIAGVISGIGFIGAGLVLRGNRGMLTGVTSAASVFAVAAIGVVAGTGHPVLAVTVTVLVVVDLELRHLPGLSRLDARRYTAGAADDLAPPRDMPASQ